MAQQDKYPTYQSPVGTLIYPFLNIPRDYQNDGKFKYDTGFRLTGADAAAFEAWVEEQHAAACAELGTDTRNGTPVREAKDDNKQPIEDATDFRFKVAAEVKTKKGDVWDRKPTLYQPDGNPYPQGEEPRLGTGTKARIGFQLYARKGPQGVSLTLQPTIVQVIELVEFVGGGRPGNANDFFGGSVAGSGQAPPAAGGAPPPAETGAQSAGRQF